MSKEEIMKYIDNLSWDETDEVQLQAMSKLKQIDEDSVSLLIQCLKKPTWGNAVKVIKDIGFPKNKSAIPKIIWLLKDVNWPGAWEGIDVLKEMDIGTIILHIENALIMAEEEKDYMWIAGIQILVEQLQLSSDNFSRIEVFELLKLADW